MERNYLLRRVKELRRRRGFSQELLAEESGLSLRTIQRIEQGETVPRGDTLTRLATALKVSPDHIIDWQIQEDRSFLTLMNLSSLGFIFFPLLGIIIPLALWILKKDKVKQADETGKSILNFQITWTITLFILYMITLLSFFFNFFNPSPAPPLVVFGVIGGLYLYNLVVIIINTRRCQKGKPIHYKPAVNFLR